MPQHITDAAPKVRKPTSTLREPMITGPHEAAASKGSSTLWLSGSGVDLHITTGQLESLFRGCHNASFEYHLEGTYVVLPIWGQLRSCRTEGLECTKVSYQLLSRRLRQ